MTLAMIAIADGMPHRILWEYLMVFMHSLGRDRFIALAGSIAGEGGDPKQSRRLFDCIAERGRRGDKGANKLVRERVGRANRLTRPKSPRARWPCWFATDRRVQTLG